MVFRLNSYDKILSLECDIYKQLKSIINNTGSDQTYSFEINNKLDDMKNLLEKLTEDKA